MSDVSIRIGGDLKEIKDAFAELKTEIKAVGNTPLPSGLKTSLDTLEESERKYIRALKDEHDQLGKNRQEQELLLASRAKFSPQAKAEIAAIAAKIDAFHREEQAAKALASGQDKLESAGRKFVEGLRNQAATIGLSGKALLDHKAAQLGVTADAGPLIAKLNEAEKGAHNFSLGTAQSTRELLVLGHEAMTGNFSRIPGSMVVLAERSNALSLIFSKTGAAIAAVAASFAGFLYLVARAEGIDRATKAIETGFEATGHAALLTDAQIKQYITTLERLPGSSRDAAEKSLTELSRVPNITGPLFARSVADLQGFALLTGKSLPDAAKELAGALEHPAKAALKLDDEFNILTAAQRLTIERFKEQGKEAQALEVFLGALEKRTKGLADNALTPLQQSSHNLRLAWDELLDTFGKTGALEAGQSAITKLLGTIKGLFDFVAQHQAGLAAFWNLNPVSAGLNAIASPFAGAQGPRSPLVSGKVTGAAESPLEADKIEHDRRVKEANDFFLKFNQEFDRGYKRKHEIEIFNAQADALIGTQFEKSAADRAKAIADINAKYKDRGTGPKDDPTKALLAGQLKAFSDQAAAEKAQLAQTNKELDTQLAAHLISIQDYYAKRKEAAEKALAGELSAIDAEITALRADQASAKRATTRAEDEKQIIALLDQKKKLQAAAASESAVQAIKEAEAYQALADKLAQINIRLQELGGDVAGARLASLLLQYRDTITQLLLSSDTAGLELMAKLFRVEIAKSRMDEIKTQYDTLVNSLAVAQQDAANQVTVGSLSQFDADQRVQAKREEVMRGMRVQIELQRQIYAQASGPEADKALATLNNMELKYNELAAAKTKLETDVANAGVSALTTFFTDIASGAVSAGEAVRNLALNFAKSMAQIAADLLARQAILATLKAFGIGGGSGGTNVTQAAAAGTAQAAPLLAASLAFDTSAGALTAASIPLQAAADSLMSAAIALGFVETAAVVAHSGGVVGSSGMTTRFNVNPLLWGAAPRFHRGGIAGIGPDERAIVARVGEEVITANDPRHRNNGGLNQGEQQRIRIVNVTDPGVIHDAMASPGGERVIMNVISRNRTGIKQSLG